jgi:proteic killer suppression protein
MGALRRFARNKQIVYSCLAQIDQVDRSNPVIRSFADKDTERLFATGNARRLPQDIVRRALTRLKYLDIATSPEDLREPVSNRLELLAGNRAGQWSIRINDQWRLCFRFEGGHAFDVEIVDYH